MENWFGCFTSTLSPTHLQTFRALLRNEEEIGELLMVIILNCQHLFDCNTEKINMILGSKFKWRNWSLRKEKETDVQKI